MPKLLKSSLAHKIYIDREGCRLGPFTLEEVNKALADGELSLSDQAWTEGMTQWVRLKEFPNVRHPFIPKLKRWFLLLLVAAGWTAGNFLIAPKIAALIVSMFTDNPNEIAGAEANGGRFVFIFLEMPLGFYFFKVYHMYKTDSQIREAEKEREKRRWSYRPPPAEAKERNKWAIFSLILVIIITAIVLIVKGPNR